jgi:hypothetical protein
VAERNGARWRVGHAQSASGSLRFDPRKDIAMMLHLLFWAFFASSVVHILDETLFNGGFVAWVAANFWPTYRMRMFFCSMPQRSSP